jgi:hypothetical protein
MKNNMKKLKARGQIQLGETTAVVIIVIMLLIIGIVFWGKVSSSNVKSVQSQSQELSVIAIANIVPELSELKCYESSVSKVKCLDWYKIRAMGEATSNLDNETNRRIFEFYNTYFEDTKITIVPMYPEDDIIDINNITTINDAGTINDSEERKGKVWNVTIYDAKSEGKSVTTMIYIPVNIKDYTTSKTYYGLIIVEGYYSELT